MMSRRKRRDRSCSSIAPSGRKRCQGFFCQVITRKSFMPPRAALMAAGWVDGPNIRKTPPTRPPCKPPPPADGHARVFQEVDIVVGRERPTLRDFGGPGAAIE